ncbi:hypothetical protein ACLOJK_022061 [Asimina triloba]
MSPSSAVKPMERSKEGQHWRSMIRMARQQLGPKDVSLFMKKRITSPVQALSSISELQQSVLPSCSRAARLRSLEVGRAAASMHVNVSTRERKKSFGRAMRWEKELSVAS